VSQAKTDSRRHHFTREAIHLRGVQMILVGIDPGVNTGVAVWNAAMAVFERVESMQIHQAMDLVRIRSQRHHGALVALVEDARLRTWFGKSGPEVWQGAGSIKRDCGIWEDFLRDSGISFLLRKPRPAGSKWPSPMFKAYTKWPGKTNEHSRDAGALVYGINMPSALSLLAMAECNLKGAA
jgi:hypothetical protein